MSGLGYDSEGNKFEIKSTKQAQINSVIAFMSVLHYDYVPDEFIHGGASFYSTHPYSQGRAKISMRTAIYLHNMDYKSCEIAQGRDKAFKLGSQLIYFSDIYSAEKAKLVEVAKLQYSRKNKKIVCQNHMVTFTSLEAQALYLGEI